MGSLVSPTVANIYTEHLKEKAIGTAENLPRLWKWFVDEIFVMQHTEHKKNFLKHINNIESAIKLTVQDTQPDGSMPFLDILITLKYNGTLTTNVYRKPILMDQYSHSDSHHHIVAKCSVINTLVLRTNVVSFTIVTS